MLLHVLLDTIVISLLTEILEGAYSLMENYSISNFKRCQCLELLSSKAIPSLVGYYSSISSVYKSKTSYSFHKRCRSLKHCCVLALM